MDINTRKVHGDVNDYEEFGDIAKYGKPELKDLMNWIAARVPADWMELGIQLDMTHGVLEGIKVDISNGGNPQKMLQKVLINWEKAHNKKCPYTWATILQALASPSVNQKNLADEIALRLKGLSVEKVRVSIEKVVEVRYQDLCNILSGSLVHFARGLFEQSLISMELCNQPNYDLIVKEILSKTQSMSTVAELETHCNKFLLALANVGPPVSLAAKQICKEWKDEIRQNTGIEFNINVTI